MCERICQRLWRAKNAIVQGFRDSHERRVAAHPNLHLYRGHAQFLSPRTLQVGQDILESEKIFINTGARPNPPRLEGLESAAYLTNETLMQLEELPGRLIVLGGGYVGLEFGQKFRRFGSRVMVIHSGDQILAREDSDVAKELQKALEAEGVEFFLNAKAIKVEKQDGQIVVTVASGGKTSTVAGTHLLAATGRRSQYRCAGD